MTAQGEVPRLRLPALHNHQLSRHAWMSSPSTLSSPPPIPSMQPCPFAPPCVQVRSARSTSTCPSGEGCCVASFFDTWTIRSWRPLGLWGCCFRRHIFLLRDAHTDVRMSLWRCGGDERGRPLCAAGRVWRAGASADMGMYSLCARHVETVSVLLMLSYPIMYNDNQH